MILNNFSFPSVVNEKPVQEKDVAMIGMFPLGQEYTLSLCHKSRAP